MVSRPVPVLPSWQELFFFLPTSLSLSPQQHPFSFNEQIFLQQFVLMLRVATIMRTSSGYHSHRSGEQVIRAHLSFSFTTNTHTIRARACPFENQQQHHMILLRRSIVDARVCIKWCRIRSERTNAKTSSSSSSTVYICPPNLHEFLLPDNDHFISSPLKYTLSNNYIFFSYEAASAWIETNKNIARRREIKSSNPFSRFFVVDLLS